MKNLRIREVATRTGYSEGHVYRLIREGKLHAEPLHVGFRDVHSVPEADVDALFVSPGGEAA